MRLRFWLFCLDVVFALGGYGTRPYYWCLERPSDATDWGAAPGAKLGEKEPF